MGLTAIQWRSKDEEKLIKEIKSFNRAIYKARKEKTDGSEALPQTISLSKKNISTHNGVNTRKDFNNMIKSLKRIHKKDSTKIITNNKGNSISKYALHEAEIKVNTINRNKARDKARFNINPEEKGIVGELKEAIFKPKKVNFENRTSEEWEMFLKVVNKQASSDYLPVRMEEFKINYLTAIQNALIDSGSLMAKELYNYIEKMDNYVFYKHHLDDASMTIDFCYDPQEADLLAKEALNKWKLHVDGIKIIEED